MSVKTYRRCETCGNRLGYRTLPSAPLFAYLIGRYGDNRSAWARATGVERTHLSKMATRQSKIYLSTADRVCDALGVHPVELWGDLYYDAAGVA